MENIHDELLNAQETILEQQKIIAERDARIVQLEKEKLELQSGQSNSALPVSIDMNLDRPFSSRE